MRLRERVFERKPFLRNIIDKLGDKSLLQYVHGYADTEIHPLMLDRQEEFLDSFEREVTETISPEAAVRARAQLKRTFFGSTNDHHGPMNAFDCFNAHVTLALAAMATDDKTEMDAIIVFSCCNISLNNVSFPRGLMFHTETHRGIESRRLSLLPSNAHACSLYGHRAYEMREVAKLQKLLRDMVREGAVRKDCAAKLEHIVNDIFGDPSIVNRATYSAQSSLINSRLWDLVFAGQVKAPLMVNVGQERLVARLLSEHHLHADTVIHRFLFNQDHERMIRKHFDGIYGAFTVADNLGTYLFWGRSPESGMRLNMRKEGNELISSDGTLRIPWTPEGIAHALEQKTILPGILLVFVTMSFYYGVKCLGGYSQVNYLTFMKEAFMAMMRELGDPVTADACMPVSTKNWSGFTFSYLQSSSGSIVPAHFLDLHLYGDTAMWRRLMAYAHECTLRHAVEPLLPEVYRYSYQEHEREQPLLGLTADSIATATGLKPCIHLSPVSVSRTESIAQPAIALTHS